MLNFWQAVILGLIQGLTEFLPVSSSGHLVIFQALFGLKDVPLAFDVILHLGTLIAVFAIFGRDLIDVFRKPGKELALYIAGSIPIGLMGYFGAHIFAGFFASLTVVGCALVVTGFLLFISDGFSGQKRIKEMSFGHALLVGFFQGLAITPGLSRSGSTIFGALLCGLSRKEAARFSFLLSIPAILGASFFQLVNLEPSDLQLFSINYIWGTIAAAISGYLAIKFFLRLLEKKSLRYFSYYCWIIATIVLVIFPFVL
ncbi:MAG: undecaprenyl-diphosphate phosphatase [Bacillota bacterium]|jgi:undecaprenyl-diphosphatase